MGPDDQPDVNDAADFTPWLRPVPENVLGGARKILLIGLILLGVHQLFPAITLGSSLSNTFTLLVAASWLAPVIRMVSERTWARRPTDEEAEE